MPLYILNNEKKSEIALFLLNLLHSDARWCERKEQTQTSSLSAAIGICFATILPDRQPARRLFSLNFRCESPTNSFLSCKPLPAQLRAEKAKRMKKRRESCFSATTACEHLKIDS
jgi:hypothetical protein